MSLVRPIWMAFALFCVIAATARAQDDPHEHHSTAAKATADEHEPASSTWSWTMDANVFAGYNYQQRQFADFKAWESQNWFMGSASRSAGGGRLTIGSMLSLEPFTLHAHGSPQLFQTGESFKQAPLLNYQHPHDLLMELGATYERPVGRLGLYIGADLVGSPTLGPIPFMHRESARSNPQVPLTHHFMDATHITTGVVRGGVNMGPVTIESSVFRGAESDENRLNVERPRLDSWAARVQYNAGPWHAQFSGGHLRQPEWFDPFDVTLLTASVGYNGHIGPRRLDLTLAWGGHREFNGFNGDADGYLAEGEFELSPRSTIYGRVEHTGKDL